MRSTRRRNWFVRRIVVGLAVAAVAAPVAQAGGVEDSRLADRGVSSVTAGDYGMPRAMPTDYAIARGDGIELVRAQPRGSSSDRIEFVRSNREAPGPELVAASGFNWSDASAGAGVTFALVLLVGGATLAIRSSGGRTQTT